MSEEIDDEIKILLSQKMSFLFHNPCPRRVGNMGKHSGLKGLCARLEEIGMTYPRTTIRDQIKHGNLCSKFQSDIAKLFDFSLVEHAWHTGTCKEFETYYLKRHSTAASRMRHEGPTLAAVNDGNGCWWTYDFLASIELFVPEHFPQESRLHATLICRPCPTEIGEIYVRYGKAELASGDAIIEDIAERSADKKWPIVQNDMGEDISLERAGGSSNRRLYKIKSTSGPIGEVQFSPDFWRVKNLKSGDVVEVTFSAFIRDFNARGDSLSFARLNGKLLGVMKQKIFDRLRLDHLPLDKDGWVLLCGHRLRYEEKAQSDQKADKEGLFS